MTKGRHIDSEPWDKWRQEIIRQGYRETGSPRSCWKVDKEAGKGEKDIWIHDKRKQDPGNLETKKSVGANIAGSQEAKPTRRHGARKQSN